MKKTILIAAIVSVFSVSATYAQDAPPKKEKEEKTMKDRKSGMHNYDDLNLTQDQKDKMKVLGEDARKQMKEVRDNSSLTDEQKKEKIQEFRKAQKEKRDKILTPEQSAKLDAKMKDHKRGEMGKKDKDKKDTE